MEATHVGVHDFDHVAPDLSADGLEARRAWREGARASLQRFSETDAEPEAETILIGACSSAEIAAKRASTTSGSGHSARRSSTWSKP